MFDTKGHAPCVLCNYYILIGVAWWGPRGWGWICRTCRVDMARDRVEHDAANDVGVPTTRTHTCIMATREAASSKQGEVDRVCRYPKPSRWLARGIAISIVCRHRPGRAGTRRGARCSVEARHESCRQTPAVPCPEYKELPITTSHDWARAIENDIGGGNVLLEPATAHTFDARNGTRFKLFR